MIYLLWTISLWKWDWCFWFVIILGDQDLVTNYAYILWYKYANSWLWILQLDFWVTSLILKLLTNAEYLNIWPVFLSLSIIHPNGNMYLKYISAHFWWHYHISDKTITYLRSYHRASSIQFWYLEYMVAYMDIAILISYILINELFRFDAFAIAQLMKKKTTLLIHILINFSESQ
jgi:hypothetical protein